ncbi:pentapeptide repeat-containing protein [Actinokineospora sp. HUAS TT18]|uniref:pentapeptide repeat-containing protein n=1 Tax=Actinokineospora sp. HUAS TT18 TaxID=3447451 RepID=UPI003F51E019
MGKLLVSALGGLFIVGALVVATIAVFADNVALLAIADTGTYIRVIVLGAGLGLARLLYAKPVKNLATRVTAFCLAIGCVGVGVTIVPTVYRAVRAQSPAKTQAAQQSTPLRLDTGSLSHSAHREQDLSGSLIVRSTIEDVDFGGARLTESDLRFSTFVRVNFAGADLCGVDLRGADLSRASHLGEVKNWDWVFYDDATKVPDGLDLALLDGPVHTVADEVIYSCAPNRTRQIMADGQRR